MYAVLDIIIVLIIIICVALGYKNGFVKTVMNFLCFVIAFIAAKAGSPFLRDIIYENWISRSVSNIAEKVGGQINSFVTGNLTLSELVKDPERPGKFTQFLKGYGINLELPDIQKWLSEAAEKSVESGKDVATGIAEYIALTISYFIAFVLIFIVALILLKIATIFLNRVVKLPVLNMINKMGGLALGLLCGLGLSYIFVYLGYYIVPYIAANSSVNSIVDIIDKTFFFKWFYEHPPIDYIMELF